MSDRATSNKSNASNDGALIFEDYSDQQLVMLRLAEKYKVQLASDATGRSLSKSLAFARSVKSRGFDVTLIRWTMLRDEKFSDHWAIKLDNEFALDLTSIQFDTEGAVLQRIKGYPANYVYPTQYPSKLFADLEIVWVEKHRVPLPIMWQMLVQMVKRGLNKILYTK